jgi:PAS domain S-box-containing protein
MHSVLERQLRRVGLTDGSTLPDEDAWRELLERVDRAYTQMDQDRYLLERSLSVSSREMQEANDALDAERDRLRAIITSMGDGLCVVDMAGGLQFINPKGAQLVGWDEDELAGQPVLDLIGVLQDDACDDSARAPSFQDLIADGHSYRCEGTFRRRDGSAFPVDYVLTPVIGAGALTGAVLIFHDITRRRQAEEAIEYRNRQIQRVNHFFRATLQHMLDTVRRGASQDEILVYLRESWDKFVALDKRLEE